MEETVIRIAREVDEKRYGKYRGFVSDNRDPERRGRLKLRVPSVLADQITDWALPCFPFGGQADAGWFLAPEIDAQVWVEFEEGDLHRPIWTGAFWQSRDDVPAESALETPTTRLFKTPGGHLLQFDDKDGEEQIILKHTRDAVLHIDPNGTVILKDSRDNRLTLDAENGALHVEESNGNTMTLDGTGTVLEDANGNTIEMTGAGIKVSGQQIVLEGTRVALGGAGGEPVIKGQSFVSLYMTHVHPTGVGPSGPPVPQGEMSTLSMKVTSS